MAQEVNYEDVESCVNTDNDFDLDDIYKDFSISKSKVDEIIKDTHTNLNYSILYNLFKKYGNDENLLIESISMADVIVEAEKEREDEKYAPSRDKGHRSAALPSEPPTAFVASAITQRPTFVGTKKGTRQMGYKFQYSPTCFINYMFEHETTVYITLFMCDEKGSGKILMNEFLQELCDERPNIKYVELRAVPYMDVLNASFEQIREAQIKLNRYYRDIGFQKISSDNQFKGDVNDVMYYTQNYVKNRAGGRKRRTQKRRSKMTSKMSRNHIRNHIRNRKRSRTKHLAKNNVH